MKTILYLLLTMLVFSLLGCTLYIKDKGGNYSARPVVGNTINFSPEVYNNVRIQIVRTRGYDAKIVSDVESVFLTALLQRGYGISAHSPATATLIIKITTAGAIYHGRHFAGIEAGINAKLIATDSGQIVWAGRYYDSRSFMTFGKEYALVPGVAEVVASGLPNRRKH